MHYFVTGHTGFKGSWLIVLLRALGHRVSGFALEAPQGSLFSEARLENLLEKHTIGDVRDYKSLSKALNESAPDFAIHMAAQPLVLTSYKDPVATMTTNVDGTLNFLRAISEMPNSPVSLVVTTDKVYADQGKDFYTESDSLGGFDPYSASKAMADILTQSWAHSHPHLNIRIARAGNVIGAKDVSDNRLLPDLVRAINSGLPLDVRNPDSIRPWQHVLDCLMGYLMFLEKAQDQALPLALNFGPDDDEVASVTQVLKIASVHGFKFSTNETAQELPKSKETAQLRLDSSKARGLLGWKPKLGLQESVGLSLEQASGLAALELAERHVALFLGK